LPLQLVVSKPLPALLQTCAMWPPAQRAAPGKHDKEVVVVVVPAELPPPAPLAPGVLPPGPNAWMPLVELSGSDSAPQPARNPASAAEASNAPSAMPVVTGAAGKREWGRERGVAIMKLPRQIAG